MPGRRAPKTWAEQLADLDDPAPKGMRPGFRTWTESWARIDLDPEANGDGFEPGEDASDDGTNSAADEAREHYEVVGYTAQMPS